jgi:multidrug efflux pump subunit AcrA (membrane-fusion protein)
MTPFAIDQASAAFAKSSGPSPQKRPWRLLSWPALAVFVVALLVTFFQPWRALRSELVSTASQHNDAPRTVYIDRPAPATTASVVLPATFRPWQTTTLHARVDGYLTAWHRDLGAQVRAGDLLAEIETPELDQELAEGEALARESAAAVVQAQAERTEAEAELKVAEAQLSRVRADLELARSLMVRREQLLTKKFIPQEEYDTAARQAEARSADVAAAESDVVRRRANLETRAAIIAARESTAQSRQANVDRLKELQLFKRIVAPFDGVVTHRSAEVGMLVTAGKESLFTVEDVSRIRVHISVPQTYAMQTRSGVAATISLPESSTPAVPGAITRIAESVDASSRTMLAEIELENAAYRFQPGSYAQVTLTVPQDAATWTIPTNTLSMRVDGPHVALVNDQNQIEMQRVSLGRDLGTRVVVVDGIEGGERLVVNPTDDLISGVRIQVNDRRESAREVAQR